MNIKGYGHSVIGKRDSNQDSFLVESTNGLFAVADGVGGGVKGDVASQKSVAAVKQWVKGPDDLKTAFEKAQDEVLKEALSTVGSPSMGSTLTTVLFQNDQLHLCHVGDSRCYRLIDGSLQLLTEDQEYYDESMQSNVLSCYIGIPKELYPLKLYQKTLPVSPGSTFIISSDGLYKQLEDSQIVHLIDEFSDTPENIPSILCEEASQHEYSDNVTVVVINT